MSITVSWVLINEVLGFISDLGFFVLKKLFYFIAENNRHVFGIVLHIGGHFELTRSPWYGSSVKALNYVGGTIWHIDDVEAFNFDLKDLNKFALRFGYEVGSLMYYGHNCYFPWDEPLHNAYPLHNADNLKEFIVERTSPYEPLFDMYVIKDPTVEFWSEYCANIPLRELTCDQTGKRANKCINVGTHCGIPLLLRDVAFDPEKAVSKKAERRQREDEGEKGSCSSKKARK